MSLEVLQMLESYGVTVLQPLTVIESNVLDALVSKRGTAVSKVEIENRVYGRGGKIKPASNCVEVFVARLRKKLSHRDVIQTVRRRGYMVVLNVVEQQKAQVTDDVPVTRVVEIGDGIAIAEG